jgi:uncharacterized membrane protein YkoI
LSHNRAAGLVGASRARDARSRGIWPKKGSVMHLSRKAVACVAAAIFATAITVRADDEDAMAKAPAAVQATAKKVLGDKKCEGFDKEDADGKPAYEVSYKVDGVDHSTLIAENGDVISEETDVDLAKVPAAVIEAAKTSHADGKIDEAAIVTEDGKSCYELDVIVGKDTHEIKISNDGKVISDSIEKPEADENDKADKDEKKEGKDKD